jgi:hypothetical protein
MPTLRVYREPKALGKPQGCSKERNGLISLQSCGLQARNAGSAAQCQPLELPQSLTVLADGLEL